MKIICIDNNRLYSDRLGVIGKVAKAVLLRTLLKKVNPGHAGKLAFLIPETLRASCEKKSLRCFSWDELTLKADFHHEKLLEFHHFVEEAAKILCAPMGSEVDGSILRLKLLSPLADDLPFFLTGFAVLCKELDVSSVEFIGMDGTWAAIVEEVAKANGKVFNKEITPLLRLLSWLNKGVDKLIALRETLKTICELMTLKSQNASEIVKMRGGIAYACPKDRTAPFLLPVAEQLYPLSQIFISPLSINVSPRNKNEFAISVLAFGKTGFSLVLEYLNLRWRAATAWRRGTQQISTLKISYRDFDIFPLYGRTIRELWISEGPLAVLMNRRMGRLIENIQPLATVSFDPLPIGSLLLRHAKQRNIPTVMYYAFFNGFESAQLLIESCYPGAADLYLVINDWMKQRISGNFLSPQAKVVAVGDVRMSIVAKRESPSAAGPMVFCTRPLGTVLTENERAAWINAAVAAAASAGRHVLFKPHPYENRAELLQFCGPNAAIAEPGIANAEIFAKAGLVIAPAGSSVAMEAFYLRVPVILYGSEAVVARMDYLGGSTAYRRFGGGVSVTDPKEMAAMILKLLNDLSFRKAQIAGELAYAERMYGPPDGLAPKRFADSVREEIRSRGI